MPDLQDLAEYVRDHPEDHEQRWKLAKRLYMAWEYQAAEEHLRILQREWDHRLNVVRYLAATYYRLGRYEEAAEVLREATREWPNEVPLYQQLARVLERGGHREEAASTWEVILRLNPINPVAAQAIQRLRLPIDESPSTELGLHESDDGIALSRGVICAHCGAHNSIEFERCRECYRPLLRTQDTPMTPAHGVPARSTRSRLWLWILVVGLLAVAILTVDLYLTLRGLIWGAAPPGAPPGSATLGQTLAVELLPARLAAGLALLVGWPPALWLALRGVGCKGVSRVVIVLSGVLLAAANYLVFWTPLHLIPAALVAPAVGSFALIATSFPLRFGQAVGVWLIQGAITLSLALGAFAGVEGIRPFIELPRIMAYSAHSGTAAGVLQPVNVSGELPRSVTLRWGSTGSTWLDEKVGTAQIIVTEAAPGQTMTIAVERDAGEPVRATFDHVPYHLVFPVSPNANHYLQVWSTTRGPFVGVVTSLLPPATPGAV